MLAVGLRLASEVVAAEMLDAFIATEADETSEAIAARRAAWSPVDALK